MSEAPDEQLTVAGARAEHGQRVAERDQHHRAQGAVGGGGPLQGRSRSKRSHSALSSATGPSNSAEGTDPDPTRLINSVTSVTQARSP
ncbi:hypothetical protein [Streptomyces sp. NPDC001165]|uniref:hypothetical protein n=1 Tax=Streptomyces sp. NPDC001165 TaxID=3364546 RepID=UPI003683CF93